MTISVTISVQTHEDAVRASALMSNIATFLPTDQAMLTSTFAMVQEATNSVTVSSDVVETTEELAINPTDARAAEAALLSEAVATAAAGKRRGRPKKTDDTPNEVKPVIVEDTVQHVVVTNDDDLVALLGVTSDAETAVTQEVSVGTDDDIMALLGGPETTDGKLKDKYDDMEHDALYADVRTRCGRDIKAPKLAEVIREATQQDRKITSVHGFSAAMLRGVLRRADGGEFK